MMRLDRYVGGAILAATLFAWLVISALDLVFALLGQLGDIGQGDYGLADAVIYVLLGMPVRAYQSFPMAVLIGTLLGLGSLSARAELDAFRLAGCSERRLVRAVLQAGVVLLIPVVLIGELWAPRSQQLAQQVRSQAIYEDLSIQRDAGFWIRDGRRFVQVARSSPDGVLSGIRVYQLGAGARLDAATAVAQAVPQQQGWLLEQVGTTRFATPRLSVESSETLHWSNLVDVRLALLLTRSTDSLLLGELGEYIRYLRSNGSDVSLPRLDYWQRWAAPLSVLATLLFALVLVLGPLARRGLGQRLLSGVLAGIAFRLLSDVVAHASLVYGLGPVAGALALPLGMLLILIVVMLRNPRF
jgi:lipopolysaccharide export system permease protein